VPVQFDPAAMRASIERLLTMRPRGMYVTHYGRVGDVERLARQGLAMLDDMVALGRAQRHASARHARLREGLLDLYLRSLRAHGCAMSDATIAARLEMDLELNAQGLGIWLDRQ
jgi:hypothetical protein